MTISVLSCPPPLQSGVIFRSYQGEIDHPTIARFDHMGINLLGFTDPPAQMIFAESQGETEVLYCLRGYEQPITEAP